MIKIIVIFEIKEQISLNFKDPEHDKIIINTIVNYNFVVFLLSFSQGR